MTKRNPTQRAPTKRMAMVLFAAGIVFCGVWMTHTYLKFRALTIHAGSLSPTHAEEERKPKPTHIFSRWFLDVGVDDAYLLGDRWSISDNHASYLTTSARPGEGGNIIMYGHNKRTIMGNIRAYKGKEFITLTLADGSKKDYRVVETHEVEPTEVKFLQPTEEEMLTLYTCSGFWDRKRFIVRAKPV